MYDKFYQKFHYSGKELDRLKDALNFDLIIAQQSNHTPIEIQEGYGASTLVRISTSQLLPKVKAAAPNIHKLIESKITLAEHFFGKKIQECKLERLFANQFKKGAVVTKHVHGSFEKRPYLIFIIYLHAEVSSGNLILHTEEEDIIISLSPGDLIVHPGYIPHSVSEYKGNIPRLGLVYEYSLKFD